MYFDLNMSWLSNKKLANKPALVQIIACRQTNYLIHILISSAVDLNYHEN